MATNVGTEIVITGRLVMEGVLVVGRHNAAIADTVLLQAGDCPLGIDTLIANILVQTETSS